jgi:uncharacterized protein YwqG
MGLFDFFFKKQKPQEEKIARFLEYEEVINGLKIPKEFAVKWDDIKQTALDYIEIKTIPASNGKTKESGFGTYPFIPKNFDYPKDADGNPMIPLAQLNFAEIPKLQDYPTKGILQFYISNTDCYGLDFDNQFNQNSFRVIYIENPDDIEEETEEKSFIKELLFGENSPVFKPHKLNFVKKTEYIGMGDFRKDHHDFKIQDYIETFKDTLKEKLEEAAYDAFNISGHKIGGYAYFTQTDPREDDDKLKDYILLFQMDSDDEIMWGDVGVGNFFITKENLLKKDFSTILYNWDCC